MVVSRRFTQAPKVRKRIVKRTYSTEPESEHTIFSAHKALQDLLPEAQETRVYSRFRRKLGSTFYVHEQPPLLDFRPLSVFAMGHLPFSTNIPLSQLKERAYELPPPKEIPVHVINFVGKSEADNYRKDIDSAMLFLETKNYSIKGDDNNSKKIYFRRKNSAFFGTYRKGNGQLPSVEAYGIFGTKFGPCQRTRHFTRN